MVAESAESLFRRGMISPKAAAKHKLKVLRKTKSQPSKMADFDGKDGVRDQGRGRDKGAVDADRSQIDRNQSQTAPGVAKVTKGGAVNRSGQPHADHIDEEQHPEFPAGTKSRAAHGKRQVGVVGPPAKSSGPQYGGPSSRGKYV